MPLRRRRAAFSGAQPALSCAQLRRRKDDCRSRFYYVAAGYAHFPHESPTYRPRVAYFASLRHSFRAHSNVRRHLQHLPIESVLYFTDFVTSSDAYNIDFNTLYFLTLNYLMREDERRRRTH